MKTHSRNLRPFLRAILSVSTLSLVAPAAAQQPNNPPQKAGFPGTLTGPGAAQKGSLHGHVTVADLGLTPGKKSIVFGTFGRRLYVVKADGTVAAGFPVTLPADLAGAPAVADLNADGQPDIVVGFGSTFEPSTPGGFRAYRNNGTLLWDHPTLDFGGPNGGPPDGVPDAVVSTPAIGDIDGDGQPDVAVGSFDARVYFVRGDTGADKTGWPKFVRDTIWSSPALHDMDGDGKPEIIIGVDAHVEGPPHNTIDGGYLHVYKANGTELTGFPRAIDQTLFSSPAVGDINGDGRPEIVIGTGTFYPGRLHRVYAIACDGTNVTGWPVTIDGEVFTAPALGNLDGDAALEVVFTDNNSGDGQFHVYAYKGNGTRLWKTVPVSFFNTTPNAGDPLIADIAGDAANEILVPVNTEIVVLNAAGAQLTTTLTTPRAFSLYTQTAPAPAVADLDNDGILEVFGVCGSPFPTATNTDVNVWQVPKGTASSAPWGMFHRNEKHDGTIPGTAACLTITYGDLTLSGVVDINDVITMASHIVGNVAVGSAPFLGTFASADVNRSGVIDVNDLVLLQAFIVGNIPSLPV